MTYSEPLSQNHATLQRLLDVLDGMVRSMEAGRRIEIADATAILGFLRLFEQEYHQMPLPAGGEWALVAGIEDALRAKKARDFVRDSRQLCRMLKDRMSGSSEPAAKNQPTLEISTGLLRLEKKYVPGYFPAAERSWARESTTST